MRPCEHLDAIEIVKIEVGIGGVVGKADIAEILPHRRLCRAVETAVGDPAHIDFVASPAEVRGVERRQHGGDGRGSAGRATRQPIGIEPDNFRRTRKMVERHILLARGDDDIGRVDLYPGRLSRCRFRPRRPLSLRAAADEAHGRPIVKYRFRAGAPQGPVERHANRIFAPHPRRPARRDIGIGDRDGDPRLRADPRSHLAKRTRCDVERSRMGGVGGREAEQGDRRRRPPMARH